MLNILLKQLKDLLIPGGWWRRRGRNEAGCSAWLPVRRLFPCSPFNHLLQPPSPLLWQWYVKTHLARNSRSHVLSSNYGSQPPVSSAPSAAFSDLKRVLKPWRGVARAKKYDSPASPASPGKVSAEKHSCEPFHNLLLALAPPQSSAFPSSCCRAPARSLSHPRLPLQHLPAQPSPRDIIQPFSRLP